MNTIEFDNKFKLIRRWLLVVMGIVYLMVLVGGTTRLTGSGLSMVNWRLIMGIIPPLSDADWIETFNLYKTSPEFKIVNYQMTLPMFKKIFFWEYLHRILGRMVGAVFFFPMVYFFIVKKLSKALKLRLIVAFFLGGSQGLLGWYMVKSGLVDHPEVSHYRLAAHLSLALFILVYIFWIYLDLKNKKKIIRKRPLYRSSLVFLFLVSIQIVYGAFMAGLHAGSGFQTFPLMGDSFVPSGLFYFDSLFQNFTNYSVGVQFVHRSLAWIIGIYGVYLLYYLKVSQKLCSRESRAIWFVIVTIFIQFSLGVATLLSGTPFILSLLHQSGAVFLLLSAINFTHKLRYA